MLFTVLTAFSWDFWSFVVFRFLAGTGIGGEYSAIYSAIDELMPARLRGRVALWISGSYWGGAAIGSLLSVVILNATFLGTFYGWRVAFGLGAILGVAVLLIRRYIPENPRWLATHGRNDQAEEVAGGLNIGLNGREPEGAQSSGGPVITFQPEAGSTRPSRT